jgi:hypothetical protein
MSRQRFLFAVAISGIFVAIVATAMAIWSKQVGGEDCDAALVGRTAGITFPTGARLVHARPGAWGVEAAFCAAVEVPVENADSVITSVQAMRNENFAISRGEPLPVWWCESPEVSVLERLMMKGGGFLHIVVCRSAARCVVYVEYDAG